MTTRAYCLLVACLSACHPAVAQDDAGSDDAGSDEGEAVDAVPVAQCSVVYADSCSSPDPRARCCPITGWHVDTSRRCLLGPNRTIACVTRSDVGNSDCPTLFQQSCFARDGDAGREVVVTGAIWPAEAIGEGFASCSGDESAANFFPECTP